MNATLFKDVNGNVSSKRIAAFVGMGVALIITAYILISKTAEENLKVLTPWLIFAGSCLGITVAERKNEIPPAEQEEGK